MEEVVINIYGDKALQYTGSTAGYAEYLKRYAEATTYEERLAVNQGAWKHENTGTK